MTPKDEIADLRTQRDAALAQVAQLREALEPFAEADAAFRNDSRPMPLSPHNRVSYSEFSAAAAALSTSSGEWLEEKLREAKVEEARFIAYDERFRFGEFIDGDAVIQHAAELRGGKG